MTTTPTSTPTTMKAWLQPAAGSINMILDDKRPMIPLVGKNDVLVRNITAGVNPIDWKRAGDFSAGIEFPSTHGVDGAGVVEAVGENVSPDICKKGDRVFYHTNFAQPYGSYAEYSIAVASGVGKVPEGWSMLEAGTAGCVVFTAACALMHNLKVEAGDTVFINGGAGGVGCVAVQIARALGAAMVITTCSSRNAEFVKFLGAHHVIDYTKENVKERVLELTGGAGVAKVFDTICSDTDSMFPLVRFAGQLAFVLPAPMSKEVATDAFLKHLSIHLVLLGPFMQHEASGGTAVVRGLINKCCDLIEQKKLRVPVTKRWSFDEVQKALEYNREGRTQGKAVIVIREDEL